MPTGSCFPPAIRLPVKVPGPRPCRDSAGPFYAGARALLVSDWPVETTSARQLMTGMFAQLAADPSLSKAQALRRSMLALIDSPGAAGPGGGIEFSYAHPLFWAPFVVVGD